MSHPLDWIFQFHRLCASKVDKHSAICKWPSIIKVARTMMSVKITITIRSELFSEMAIIIWCVK